MRNFEAKVRCFISGIEIPIRRVTKSTVEGVPPVVEIDIPATESLMKVEARSMVHIFFYDKYKKCWRLWFDGETTPGRTYGNKLGKHFRTITAIAAITYLNDMPSKYLSILSVNIFTSLEYAFYGMPVKKAVALAFEEMAVDKYLDIPSKYLDEKLQNLIGYFTRFLDIAIGDKGWVQYYKNMGKRHNIETDHIFIDNGRFADIVKAEILLKLIRKINGSVIQSRTRTLDNILEKLQYVDYSYVNITTPGMAKDKIGSSSSIAGSDDIAIYHDANSLVKYAVIPNVDNTLPPKCNVIYGDKNRVIKINIVENSITRLMNKFYFTEKDNGISGTEYYPPELCALVDGIKTVKFGLLDIEKDVGMRPIVQGKDDVYEMFVADPINMDKEQQKKSLTAVRKYITREDFYKILYSRNTVSVSGDGFEPYSVVGLPGIVCDVESDKFYYGTINVKHETIDIERTSVNFSVTLRNAREIEDIREITARDISLPGEVSKWQHHKVPGWHPSMYSNYIVDENNSGKSLMTSELYEHILKGTTGTGTGKGWECVIDGMIGNEYLETDNVLKHLMDQYANDTSYENLKHREIVTMTEYFRRLLKDDDNKEKYETIENLSGKIKDKTAKRDKLDDKEWGDNIFVEERQKVIIALRDELRSSILRGA